MGKQSVDELHFRMHNDDMLNTSKTGNQSMDDQKQYRQVPKSEIKVSLIIRMNSPCDLFSFYQTDLCPVVCIS